MDLWQAIRDDHGVIDRLFRRLAGTAEDDVADRERFFDDLRDALGRHSRAEESVLYPELRLFAETREQVPGALDEHARILVRLEELAEAPKRGFAWGRRCAELDRAVASHVRLEEDVLIPAARQAIDRRQAAELLRRFQAAKAVSGGA